MSDKGEKTCPLCAEEMDLTDQQLKPCKCGYEICVWCWHHIMEMAEKDATEGRCPACRTPYDKERIVRMTADCERMVAENNVEKKKSQKTKPKSTEGRKQLCSVRVIQRNLVYIMGLPLHLGEEDLLSRREFFGQYGRILKVSMHRTAAGVVQQFPNSTCSVYITYSKEREAIRCIQSVYGYILVGKPLRACFGTTKYCHTWLRNMPCSNSDCPYLHEIGSQEDSFTRDDVVSAYTRSRIQQIIGPANLQQRRSGNVLPPPLDDYDCSVSNVTTSNRGSPPTVSSDKAIGLPLAASWATLASNSQPVAASFASSTVDTRVISSATASITQISSSQSYAPKKPYDENHSIQAKPAKHYNGINSLSTSCEKQSSLAGAPITADADSLSSPSIGSGRAIITSSTSLDSIGKPSGPVPKDVRSVYADGQMGNFCSDISTVSINNNMVSQSSGLVRPDNSFCEYGMTISQENQEQQLSMLERCKESSALSAVGKPPPSVNETYISSNECDWTCKFHNLASNISSETGKDILYFDNQRLKDAEVISYPSSITKSSKLLDLADHSGTYSLQYSGGHCAATLASYPLSVDSKVSIIPSLHELSGQPVSNGTESLNQSTGVHSASDHILVHNIDVKEYQREAVINNIDSSWCSEENNIISDILSLDFDPWDESTSPQTLAKLLRNSDTRYDSLNKISKSLKVQKNNQSRFSFARQEESVSLKSDVEPPLNKFMDNFGFMNGLSPISHGETDNVCSGPDAIFPNKLSASRFPIMAPPGFSAPSRLPPRSFYQERVDQDYGLTSGNHFLDTSSSLRSSYQVPKAGSISSPGYAQRLNVLDDEASLKLLSQRSMGQHENSRYSDIRDSYSLVNNSLGFKSRLTDHSHVNNLSPSAQLYAQQSRNSLMSNSLWDGWNEILDGESLGMANHLRNEGLRFKEIYSGYEDSNFRVSGSGDL